MKNEEKKVKIIDIKVVGVGGSGGSAIRRMHEAGLGQYAELIAINTDEQALRKNPVPRKIQIGSKLTKGLGCGADPEVGKQSFIESSSEVESALEGAGLLYITAGMGGGTGTGAIIELAKIAQKLGILVHAIITRPFAFEGARRGKVAEEGIEELKKYVNAYTIIDNEMLFAAMDEGTTQEQAFANIDDVLKNSVEGVCHFIQEVGDENVDFADLRAITLKGNEVYIGVGKASGKNRDRKATEIATKNPFIRSPIDGAGAAIWVVTSKDVLLGETKVIGDLIRTKTSENANIIYGRITDSTMNGEIRVTVVISQLNSMVTLEK